MSEFKDVESKGVPFQTVLVSQSHESDFQTIIIEKGLRRGLLERHISLISLASVIGASCFYGFGYALYLSGPLGWVVWALMQSIGEVTTMFPIAGGFIEHANRFVDPALGFAIAWTYYFMWSMFLGSEWNGAILILQYWVSNEQMPSWAWVIVFAVFFSILTTRGVVVYGEVEYYLGWFKIFSLFICFFLSLLVNVGAFGNGYIGFKYWKEPTGPIINGINGFGQVFVLAAGYYVGTEIISLAAGETKDPIKSIPKGVKNVVWRILFVYIGLIFFQGLVCPSNSEQLINADSKSASSPFTIAFTNAGWSWSGHFVNTLITIAFISSANGTIYVQSRSLYSLALSGRAPKIFTITSKTGVPYVAVLTSVVWGFLALMNLGTTAGQVFKYLITVGGSASYITWAGIIFTHLRLRAGLDKQGVPQSSYPFKAFGSIWIYRLNLFLCIFLLLIQGFTAFERPFDVKTFITSYITIPVSVLLFLGWKLWKKTHWVRLSEMDFSDRLVKPVDDEVDYLRKPSIRSKVTALFTSKVGTRRRHVSFASSVDTLVANDEEQYRGFVSEEEYLKALREWIESKCYYESDTHIHGWYGTKTKQDYLNEPSIFGERRARKTAEKLEKERRRQQAAVAKLTSLPENDEAALQDIVEAGFRRWDGTHRVTTDWLNVFNEPELQWPGGDVLVYLREPGQSSRGPALRVHSDKVRAKGFGVLLKRCVSLPSPPTLSSCIINNCSGCQAHPPAKELYIPAPQGSDLDATFDHHITTRNFFAWIYDLPLAGRSLGWSLRQLKMRMDTYRPRSQEHNLKSVLAFAETQRYLDFRECIDHALAALGFAEAFEIEDLWIDAFTHCVGLAHRGLRDSLEYELISERSKRLINEGRVELEVKLDRVMRTVSNFFEHTLAGDFRGLPPRARDHMDRFRSFLHSYYIDKFGFWPPPNFHQEAVEKEVYRSLYADFRNLYQHLADPKSALLGTDPDIAAHGGVYTLQSIRKFDARHHYQPLPLSLPMLPCPDSVRIDVKPKLRKLNTWNPIAKRKMAREHRNARRVQALIDASNRDWMIMNDSLVRRFSEFEAESALGFEALSLEDGRKVRWIAIYAILQILASVIESPKQVRNSDGLSYSLCCRIPDRLPWVPQAQSAAAGDWASKQILEPDLAFTHTNSGTKEGTDWGLSRRSTISRSRRSADRTISLIRSVSSKSLRSIRSDPTPKLSKQSRRASFCEIYVPGYGNGLNDVRLTSSRSRFDLKTQSSHMTTASAFVTQDEEDEVSDHVPSLHQSDSSSGESSTSSISSTRSSLTTHSLHDAAAAVAVAVAASSSQLSLGELGLKTDSHADVGGRKSPVSLIDIVDKDLAVDTIHFNTLTWDNILRGIYTITPSTPGVDTIIESIVLIHAACILNDKTVATFLPPLSHSQITQSWQGFLEEAGTGGGGGSSDNDDDDKNDSAAAHRIILVSVSKLEISAVVSLHHPSSQTGPFRALVQRLLVSPLHRRRGLATQLVAELERRALQRGWWNLMLDSEAGSAAATTLYPKLGYQTLGVVPHPK
ncbi:hypothetical protein DV738_g5, partial [Chaetothyriales sp. CBS 135597]